jgi:hypothetical protein
MSEFSNHNTALQGLLGFPVSIHHVSSADVFYTDGAASGATYRLQMPDSSMVYVRADGSEHWVSNSPLYDKHSAMIQYYIANELKN